MRRAAVGVAAVALLAGCTGKATKGAVDTPAPRLVGDTVTGVRTDAGPVAGTPVLVNFWATWCEPCKVEFPRLVETAAAGTSIVGVNVRDSKRKATQFAAEKGATWPSLADPDGKLAAKWGVGQGLPVTVAVDARGIVRARHFGAASAADLEALVAAARS